MRCFGGEADGAAERPEPNDLVREHLPLVHHVVTGIAHRLPRHVHRADLVSAAMLALVQASRSYDPATGVPFERFASVRMRGAVIDELRRADWASRGARALGRAVAVAEQRLTGELGRVPALEEIAREVGLEPDAVRSVLADLDASVVLHVDSVVSGERSGEEILPATGRDPESIVLGREERSYLIDAVALLPERLRTVVVGYFFDERPMAEIGAELGVSESRVSQMRAEALVLLRDALDAALAPAPGAPTPDGIAARRRAAYYAAVAAASDHRARVSPRPTVVPRVAV